MSQPIKIKRLAGKKQDREPTIKQKKAFQKTIENHGNVSKAMREAGYTEATAKNPKNLTESDAWQDLMEEYLKDEDIAKGHQELLLSSKIDHYIFPAKEENEVITELIESIPGCKLIKIRQQQNWKRAYFWIPDNRSRKDAIDMAYKLKGKYAPEKREHSGSISLSGLFDEAK